MDDHISIGDLSAVPRLLLRLKWAPCLPSISWSNIFDRQKSGMFIFPRKKGKKIGMRFSAGSCDGLWVVAAWEMIGLLHDFSFP